MSDFTTTRIQLADMLLEAPDDDHVAKRITQWMEEMLRAAAKGGETRRMIERMRDWIADLQRPRCPISNRLKPKKFKDYATKG